MSLVGFIPPRRNCTSSPAAMPHECEVDKSGGSAIKAEFVARKIGHGDCAGCQENRCRPDSLEDVSFCLGHALPPAATSQTANDASPTRQGRRTNDPRRPRTPGARGEQPY